MTVFKDKIISFIALFATSLIVLNRLDTELEVPRINEEFNAYRQMSTYLGDGECRWEAPAEVVPEDLDLLKTLVVGYPSGDKRVTYLQMEALTGWSAKDEWDLFQKGLTNEPFIKSNYPHHEGVWGWEDAADQVVLVIRNIRTAMIHYHDILWDLAYPQNYKDAQKHIEDLYGSSPPESDFVKWRDAHIVEEIHWYGWFIDYWMEGGLMRDPHTHNITTKEHWDIITLQSNRYSKKDHSHETIVGDEEVTMTYDPHCLHDFAEGCKPVAIISAERLINPETGPTETHKIAMALHGKRGIGDYVINKDAWDCIWEELIVNKKGLRTFLDRDGDSEKQFNFSAEILTLMLEEVDRLIEKYSDPVWILSPKVPILVSILTDNRNSLLQELSEVETGVRELRNEDFLGPKTRAKREQDIAEGKLYW